MSKKTERVAPERENWKWGLSLKKKASALSNHFISSALNCKGFLSGTAYSGLRLSVMGSHMNSSHYFFWKISTFNKRVIRFNVHNPFILFLIFPV